MLLYIATTRFNNETWEQNLIWRERNNWKGCIYGTPTRIKDVIPNGANVIIIEMNNDKNKIMGFGLIKKKEFMDKKYNIYEWGNYNRYIYKGKYRIDRENIMNDDEELVFKVLDMLVFKGSRHLKRGHGIICLPEWILNNKVINFKEKLKNMFLNRYNNIE